MAEATPAVDWYKQLFETNQADHDKTGTSRIIYIDSDDKLGAADVANAYSLRGLIKYALSDKAGALADLGNAIDYIGKWRRGADEIHGFDRFTRPYLYSAYLYRSAVYYRRGKAEEALADFNEYAALSKLSNGLIGTEADKLRLLLLQALKGSARPNQTANALNIPPSDGASTDKEIRGEIDSIVRGGQYSPLPDALVTRPGDSGRTTARRVIRNDTAYSLHVLMIGPTDRKLDLPPGGSLTVDLPPGSYTVAARVDSVSVRPFYGAQVLESGVEYTSQFHIR